MTYMVVGVIMVPQRAARLAVGVVVVLELVRGNQILRPTVKGRSLYKL